MASKAASKRDSWVEKFTSGGGYDEAIMMEGRHEATRNKSVNVIVPLKK